MQYCVDKGIPHDTWLSWEPSSRAKHMAYLLFDAEICQLCGTAQWEWDENPYAYKADEQFCKGCYIKHMASDDKSSLPGSTTVLVANTDEQKVKDYLAWERRNDMDFGDDD